MQVEQPAAFTPSPQNKHMTQPRRQKTTEVPSSSGLPVVQQPPLVAPNAPVFGPAGWLKSACTRLAIVVGTAGTRSPTDTGKSKEARRRSEAASRVERNENDTTAPCRAKSRRPRGPVTSLANELETLGCNRLDPWSLWETTLDRIWAVARLALTSPEPQFQVPN